MSDDSGYKAGQIRDSIEDGSIDAVLEAYETDIDSAADLLMLLDRAGVDEDNDLREALARQTRTETLRGARQQGDLDTLSSATGITDERVDAAERDLSDEVNRLFRPSDRDHMLNLVLYAPPPPEGPTGVGKTDFAYRILEEAIIDHLPHGGLEVASNNRSDPFADVESWTELEAWLEETDGTKAFLWDEAAQVLQYADMSAGKALSQLIKLLRKYNCHLLLIAHTGKDIPKDVRRMVLFAQKESKKKATIGAGLEENSSGWMVIRDELMRFGDIDATSIEYDSEGDTGDFEFDKGQTDDADESEELPLRKCRGHNRRGESCGQRTRHESGYCDAHRDEWDGDPDPRLEDDGGDEQEEDVTNDEEEVEELVADAIASNADALVEGDHLAAIRQTISAAQAAADDEEDASEGDVEVLADTLASRYDLDEDEAREMAEDMVED